MTETQNSRASVSLLRALDDPEWIEWPKGYNRTETAALFGSLVSRLESDFSVRCMSDQDGQDSSEYGRVTVPADSTVCGTRIVVCISKFGSLALICADNPGAFFGTEDARNEGELDDGDLAKVDRALVELGYSVVSEELLETAYDGPSLLYVERPTWSDRFFGIF
ncbi:hypothetical protein [Streptomyces sp. NPDC048428]|uniref:hypothetical protein n=1 Tax=Streptomyces sp. NPDC048428 TaxID=3154503 RepID=UPI00341DFC3F